MEAVPFTVDLGVSTIRGMARLEKEGLTLDWQTYGLMGAPSSELAVLVIPYDRIRHLECVRRLGRARIIVRTRSAADLATIPKPEGDLTELRLTVKRRNRGDAELLAAEGTLRIAESDGPELLES